MAGFKEGALSLRKRNSTLSADPGYMKILVNTNSQLYTVNEHGVSALIGGGTGSDYNLLTSGNNLIISLSGSDHYIDLTQTTVVSGSYGSSILIPKLVVDKYGRVTSAENVPISASGVGTVTSIGISSSTLSGGGTVTTSGTIFLNLSAVGTSGTGVKITYDRFGRVISTSSLIASDIPSGIDATKIGTGNISNTEFGYLDGVSANIQTQINNINLGAIPASRISPIKYLQTIQSDTWVINHNLNRFPNAAVVLTTTGYEGKRVEPTITYPNENQMILSFSAPYTGSAHLI